MNHNLPVPRPPAHVQVYVDVLGIDLTIDLLMTLGGSECYFAQNPRGGSAVERVIGPTKTAEMARCLPQLSVRIPTARPWLAQVFHARGMSVVEICRKLHVTDVAVRKYLKTAQARADHHQRDPRQMRLF